jgi:hypothetical protein
MTVQKLVLKSLSLGLCAAALGFAAPTGAYAFTVVTDGVTNPDGSPKFADPDEKIEKFANGQDGGTSTAQGGVTFHFGAGPAPDQQPGSTMPPSMLNRFYPVPGYPVPPDGR